MSLSLLRPSRCRCREVEHEVATLQAQLVEKQAVQAENEQLRLRVDSMTAQGQMEQRKIGEEKLVTHTHTHTTHKHTARRKNI